MPGRDSRHSDTRLPASPAGGGRRPAPLTGQRGGSGSPVPPSPTAGGTFDPALYYTKVASDARFIDTTELALELAGYYTVSAANATFIDTTELSDALADYITTAQAEASFIDTAELSAELAAYYTIAQAEAAFIDETELTDAISDLASTTFVDDQIAAALVPYITTTAANATFIDSGELALSLANYYTIAAANATFVTPAQLATELTAYYTQAAANTQFIDETELSDAIAPLATTAYVDQEINDLASLFNLILINNYATIAYVDGEVATLVALFGATLANYPTFTQAAGLYAPLTYVTEAENVLESQTEFLGDDPYVVSGWEVDASAKSSGSGLGFTRGRTSLDTMLARKMFRLPKWAEDIDGSVAIRIHYGFRTDASVSSLERAVMTAKVALVTCDGTTAIPATTSFDNVISVTTGSSHGPIRVQTWSIGTGFLTLPAHNSDPTTSQQWLLVELGRRGTATTPISDDYSGYVELVWAGVEVGRKLT